MSTKRVNRAMLSREKLLPSTNQSQITFLSDEVLRKKIKDLDLFGSKHISLIKK